MSQAAVAGPSVVLHGTTIARRLHGEWRGVLVQGSSGSGKSDVALRAMAAGWRLVADDRTLVWASQGRLFGRAPSVLAGLIEARGLGVHPVSIRAMAELVLVVDCLTSPAELERMPDPERRRVLQVSLPCMGLLACEASALAKLELALQGLVDGFDRARQERI